MKESFWIWLRHRVWWLCISFGWKGLWKRIKPWFPDDNVSHQVTAISSDQQLINRCIDVYVQCYCPSDVWLLTQFKSRVTLNVTEMFGAKKGFKVTFEYSSAVIGETFFGATKEVALLAAEKYYRNKTKDFVPIQ